MIWEISFDIKASILEIGWEHFIIWFIENLELLIDGDMTNMFQNHQFIIAGKKLNMLFCWLKIGNSFTNALIKYNWKGKIWSNFSFGFIDFNNKAAILINLDLDKIDLAY